MAEESEELKKAEEDYSGSSITVLEGLEAVRVRPAMYIGSTDIRGLHHLVWEVVDNSVDEALAGFCNHIEISILPGNGIRVTDNGRGIPTDIHPKEHVGTIEVVMTKLHAGGKFDSNSYKVSAGLHGVGVSCVNALSNKLVVTVRRNGKVVKQEFSKGIPCGPQVEVGPSDGTTGTSVEFYPDDTIFSETVYVYETLATRFRELAFLMKGLRLIRKNERTIPMLNRLKNLPIILQYIHLCGCDRKLHPKGVLNRVDLIMNLKAKLARLVHKGELSVHRTSPGIEVIRELRQIVFDEHRVLLQPSDVLKLDIKEVCQLLED